MFALTHHLLKDAAADAVELTTDDQILCNPTISPKKMSCVPYVQPLMRNMCPYRTLSHWLRRKDDPLLLEPQLEVCFVFLEQNHTAVH